MPSIPAVKTSSDSAVTANNKARAAEDVVATRRQRRQENPSSGGTALKEGASSRPDATRLQRFATAMAAPATKPGQDYTLANKTGDSLRAMGQSMRNAALPSGAIPGTNASWDQFDALIRGRGLKF